MKRWRALSWEIVKSDCLCLFKMFFWWQKTLCQQSFAALYLFHISYLYFLFIYIAVLKNSWVGFQWFQLVTTMQIPPKVQKKYKKSSLFLFMTKITCTLWCNKHTVYGTSIRFKSVLHSLRKSLDLVWTRFSCFLHRKFTKREYRLDLKTTEKSTD